MMNLEKINAKDITHEVKDVEGETFFKGVPERTFKEIENHFETAFDPKKPLLERIGNFLTGESKAGRKVGAILDIVTIFIPFGGKINQARQAAENLITKKTNPKPMKKLTQTSTRTALLTIASLVAIVVGVDGETLQALVDNAWVAGSALVVAIVQIYELFRNEPETES